MRLFAGSWGGRSILAPPGIRPTSGKVREALFSIWAGRIEGAALLDLFSGSGAVGIEGLSRGADRVVLAERAAPVLRCLRSNLRQLEALQATVWRADLPRDLVPPSRVPGGPFDLVFADPPYRFTDFERLLRAVGGLIAASGQIAVEHSTRVDLPSAVESLQRDSCRRYGESALSFYRPNGDAAAVR